MVLHSKNNPLVTVIIPAYNCEGFIQYSIESVLNQTYKNIELIVVDDGSTDGTRQVVLQYKENINYIEQANGGVSKSRNTGIHHSKGEYIAFLDADDIWDRNKLEIQMICFKKHPDVEMIFSGFRHMKNSRIIQHASYQDTFNFFREYRYSMDEIFRSGISFRHGGEQYEFYWGNIDKYLFLGNFILPSSVILRKESLQAVGFFDETFRVAEETDFFLRYSRFNIMGFIKNPLLSYALPDPGNLSGKSNLEKLMKNAIKIQIDFILSRYDDFKKNRAFFVKGLSMTYSRLAYYYLTEFKFAESRRYASFALKTDRFHLKPYKIWFGTLIPKTILEHLSMLKRRGKISQYD